MVKRAKNQPKGPKIIFLEGIHGVGKSSVFHGLKKLYSPIDDTKFYPERLRFEPLFPFGSPDIQIAFRSELHFMQQMIERNNLVESDLRKRNKPKFCVLDRSAISVIIYSKSLGIKDKDLQVLLDYYHSVNWCENVMVYLRAKPETLLTRIAKRGSLEPERLQWNEDDINYIKTLEKFYTIHIRKMESKMQIIDINTEGLSLDQVISLVKEEIDNLIPQPVPPPGQKSLDSWLSMNNP